MRFYRLFLKYSAGISAIALMLLILVSAVWIRNGQTAEKKAPIPPDRKAAAAQEALYSPPCEGEAVFPYSPHTPVFNETLLIYETHEGTDYLCPDGRVFAAADGTVQYVRKDERYGLSIRIQHASGASTLYASLESSLVEPGEHVFRGEEIARAGTSALTEKYACPHVHFVYTEDGKSLPCPFASQADS